MELLGDCWAFQTCEAIKTMTGVAVLIVLIELDLYSNKKISQWNFNSDSYLTKNIS